MQFEIKQLEYETVASILVATDKEFTPPLSRVVDIEQFAIKLAKYARWAICSIEQMYVGGIAFYENSEENQLYVSLICVLPQYRMQGVGKSLLDYTVQHTCGFDSIALEVNKNNINAYSFYINYGFSVAEDRDDKFLMIKKL